MHRQFHSPKSVTFLSHSIHVANYGLRRQSIIHIFQQTDWYVCMCICREETWYDNYLQYISYYTNTPHVYWWIIFTSCQYLRCCIIIKILHISQTRIHQKHTNQKYIQPSVTGFTYKHSNNAYINKHSIFFFLPFVSFLLFFQRWIACFRQQLRVGRRKHTL